MSIINFSNEVLLRAYFDQVITVNGICKEITYVNEHRKIIDEPDGHQIEEISAIWLNETAFGNERFSFLLVEYAIEEFLITYGIMTNSTLVEYFMICNNRVLFESLSGTDKPYMRIASIDNNSDFIMLSRPI